MQNPRPILLRRPTTLWLTLLSSCAGFVVMASDAAAKRIDLVVPKPGADASAYRFDSEVIGFNRAGTEVAAVGIEVARGAQGRQRGEGFLLVYEAKSALPLRNIITRMISHPDLPHNPLPLEHASDMRDGINDSWLKQWPRAPHRRHMPGDMVVSPIWARMPAPEHGAASIHDELDAPWTEARSSTAPDALCTPYVGARLSWHGKVRIMPAIPLDVAASCSLLQLADKRIEWGRPDSAAVTYGFEFHHNPLNEESARFVALMRWEDATALSFSLVGERPLSDALLQRAHRILSPFGKVVKHPPRQAAETGAGEQLVAIETHERWLALGQMLAEKLGADARLARRHEPADHHLITFVFGSRAPRATGAPPRAPADEPQAGPAPAPRAPQNGAKPRPSFNLPDVPDVEHEDGMGDASAAPPSDALPPGTPIPKAPKDEPPPPRPGPRADFAPEPVPPPKANIRRDDADPSPYLQGFGSP